MVILRHCSDKGWFDVFARNVYIGHIWCRSDNKWILETDMNLISDDVLSDIKTILRTLNL